MNLQRGMREKIANHIDPGVGFCVEMTVVGPAVYDFSCFGIDQSSRLSDDRYMIFYNQTASPANEITLALDNNSAKFLVDLSKLPPAIDRLVFTASIDGNGTMGEIAAHRFVLMQDNTPRLSMELSGADFRQEKAVISVEIYRKGEWRIAAAAKGFNGGLSALLAAYGGTEIFSEPAGQNPVKAAPFGPQAVSDRPAPVTAPCAPEDTEKGLTQKIMGKISLSKDKVNLEKHVVSLSKCVVSLSKESGVNLGAASAKVVVVLDYSGSMRRLYTNGTV